LYPASSVRELDRIAIEERNIPGIDLMHRAGQAVFDTLIARWPDARQVLVVCGAGNNAGDGYVIARLAHEFKFNVSVVSLTSADKLKNDALTAANQYLKSDLEITDSIDSLDINNMDVIVDAIFGTGLDRDVTGDYLHQINQINHSRVPVISVDIPSGLNADTGAVMGNAVKADCTVTFIGQKQGLYTGEAAEYCGTRIFVGLNVPADIYQDVPINAVLVDLSQYETLLQPRNRTGHKGHFGHVMVTGGDYGYAGAVRMCGEAAARTGSGLVSIATRPEHAYAMTVSRPELMASVITSSADLMPLLSSATVIAVGPGLGQSQWSIDLLGKVFESKLPLVVDADALNLLAKDPLTRQNWILTPHPGEAARLLG
ncbi:MAG: NAD(P)H-hydrate epimerase, partial [Gammaproteobacteria bacterium]|nr:NAD(P)H-hydrate epimerase [Gammaproteobacteria bacterium]